MNLVLEVVAGPEAGRRFVVRPGPVQVVGRAAHVPLSLPRDRRLAATHFDLTCGESGCRLFNLPGSGGTFVNDLPVEGVNLADGDRVRAGDTEFRVQWVEDGAEAERPTVVANLPPTVVAEPPPHPIAAPISAGPTVLEYLRSLPEPLFAVLDAAREQYVLDLLRQSKEQYQSLYEGAEDEIADWGPWLVRLPPASPLLESLVTEGWGQSWGIYLTCDRPFAEVRKHLRRFLTVRLPDGDAALFRYYDPRILRAFLPTCVPAERTEFFGPFWQFLAEDGNPELLLNFARDAGRPTAAVVPVVMP